VSIIDMDEEVARAVRAELAAIGTKESRLQRVLRHARMRLVGIIAAVVVVLTTGAAIVATHFPGSTTVTPTGAMHSATHTGTGSLELGPAPADATRVIVVVRCLSTEGTISITGVPQTKGQAPGFATFYCSGRSKPWRMDDAMLPPKGSTSITITADPGTRWSVSGQYASSVTTPWAKNARGQTYGQCDVDGCPDLVHVQGENGKQGYVLDAQWTAFRGTGYLPMYASDGTTVVGRFPIGIPAG
jgi:hypothetical protein